MTTYALVQCVRVARRDPRFEHELAVLDGSDAVTNLVTPTTPSRAEDVRTTMHAYAAPGSAAAGDRRRGLVVLNGGPEGPANELAATGSEAK
jgi:hypothetical protein